MRGSARGDPVQLAKKEQKRPKVKGCYQCARRRIDCDRSEPECQKCIARDIKCDGLGLRYRFGGGLASRGKLVGKQIPDTLSYKKTPPHSSRPRLADTPSSPTISIRVPEEQEPDIDANSLEPGLSRNVDVCLNAIKTVDTDYTRHIDPNSSVLLEEHEPHIDPNSPTPGWIDVGLDHINGQTRWYLQYFSDYVAPVTAVINLGFNGYRDLILPAAEEDALVRKAIVLVADQHFALHLGMGRCRETSNYSSVIQELIRRSNVFLPHQDESTMTTLLLLHILEMISGSDDFILVYRTLRTLIAKGGYNLHGLDSDLGRFVKIQILRVCLFSEALFNERQGAQFLLDRGEDCLEFLRFCRHFHPELEELMSHLYNMIKLACEIYIHRVLKNPDAESTVAQVERFKQLTEKVDGYVGPIGQHLLAWSYFIVAAESCSPTHRSFFLKRLEALYQTTKCGNIVKAIDQVHRIWALQPTTRWTSLLGGPTQALIM